MASDFANKIAKLANNIQKISHNAEHLPSEVTPSPNQPVLPLSLFKGTRGYIEKVVYQINRSYEQTCYDACAVMIRRLVEILIIELFEQDKNQAKITNPSGDYMYLQDLITILDSEYKLGRNTKSGLEKLKKIGDQSAHSRYYNAKRGYIDDIIIDLRVSCEELLYRSELKK